MNPVTQERVGQARRMLVAMVPKSQIVASLSAKWGVSQRQAYKYVDSAYDRMLMDGETDRPLLRCQMREALIKVYQKSYEQGNMGVCVAALDRLLKLDGLDGPIRIEVAGRVDVRAMSPMERQAEIERLLEIRSQALDGRKTTPLQLPAAPTNGSGAGSGTEH